MTLSIDKRRREGVTVLHLKGRLTRDGGARTLNDTVQKLAKEGCDAILLECSQVGFLDSEGVRVLVRGVATMGNRGGTLKLLRVSPKMRQVLGVTRLLDALGVFNDEETALAAIRSGQLEQQASFDPNNEKRKLVRVPVDLLAQVESLGKGGSTLGRAADLSEGGLRVRTEETLDSDTEVDIRINLPPIPPGHPIEAKGVVVHCAPGKSMGIQFLLLSDNDRLAIREFILAAGS